MIYYFLNAPANRGKKKTATPIDANNSTPNAMMAIAARA